MFNTQIALATIFSGILCMLIDVREYKASEFKKESLISSIISYSYILIGISIFIVAIIT